MGREGVAQTGLVVRRRYYRPGPERTCGTSGPGTVGDLESFINSSFSYFAIHPRTHHRLRPRLQRLEFRHVVDRDEGTLRPRVRERSKVRGHLLVSLSDVLCVLLSSLLRRSRSISFREVTSHTCATPKTPVVLLFPLRSEKGKPRSRPRDRPGETFCSPVSPRVGSTH